MRALILATAMLLVGLAAAQFPPVPPSCNDGSKSGGGGYNCTDRPDVIPVWTKAPVHIKSVKNGERWLAGSGDDTFHVVHLYSPTDDLYEMGFALGQLFPKEIDDMFAALSPWIELRIKMALPWLPSWLAELVVKDGVPVALDFVYDITEKYIPQEFLQEWAGMAAGANCSVKKIRYVALFPQLTKAACTIFVAHHNATINSTNGNVSHLRGLDFDPRAPVGDFASVVFHHYNTKPHLANFGWIAMTGVLTGMNDLPMSVGEKMWGGHNAFLKLPIGLPWMQMVRKSLELTTLSDVKSFITNHDMAKNREPNSVSIHLGYGDGRSNDIVGFEIGYNYSMEFDWKTHGAAPTHPLYPGIVYWSKNDDAHTMCVADMINAAYGNITAEWLAMYYAPNDKTGDTQVVAFDHANMKVWVANSRKTTGNQNSSICAYYRQRTVLDMRQLFSYTPGNQTSVRRRAA